jgi:hypothetical protein
LIEALEGQQARVCHEWTALRNRLAIEDGSRIRAKRQSLILAEVVSASVRLIVATRNALGRSAEYVGKLADAIFVREARLA